MKVTGGGYQNGTVSSLEETSGEDKEESLPKSSKQFSVRDDLLNRTVKFLEVINTTLLHLKIQGLFYLIHQGFFFFQEFIGI